MKTIMKGWAGALLLLLMTLTSQAAETRIDLGEMQLNTEYALSSFKNYIGTFTAPRTGVVTCSSTTTDVMYPYREVLESMTTSGNAYDVTMNNLYGGRSYDFNVEEGKTYVMYARFIMNSNTTFKMTMAETQTINLTSTSPEEGSEFSVSNGGQISFNFDKAVSFTGATISVGATTEKFAGQISTNSIFFNAKDFIWGWLTNGTAKPGDKVTVTLSGVSMASDKSILFNGDGKAELHFILAPLPVTLVSTGHLDGNFLSYYTNDDERGILRFTFSDKVDTAKVTATLRYGNIDKDPDGDYYVEYLLPGLLEDGKTITVDLRGKRRKIADMISSSTDYGTMTVGLTGVRDEQGNYAYAEGSGSLGSYWYQMPYEEISSNVVAEFTPANGADLAKYKNIEIWITDEAKLSYDGIEFTYEKDGQTATYLLEKNLINKEADPDDATASILTVAVPDVLKDATNVTLTFRNLQCADGTDYSNVLRVKYNALVISRANPVAGSTMEQLTEGQTIRLYTNRDNQTDELQVALQNTKTNETILEGTAPKASDGKGFVFTCNRNIWLAKGTDYQLEAKYQLAEGVWSNTDYIIYHGAATKVEDYFTYGYDASGITLQDTLPSKTATISGFSNGKHTGMHYALLEMPANVSNTMDGCQITRIAFYPFLTSMTTAKVIISKEIGGTPLYEQEVSDIESQKWQQVTLDTPFTIQADERYYIGYSIESATGDYPIGYYYTSDILASATVDPILDYIGYTVEGTTTSGLLDTQMYAARRQLANLMLYATIEAPYGELPANAVAVGNLSLSNGLYIHPNDSQTLTCLYNNTGVKNLESFDVTIKDGDKVLAQQTIKPTAALKPMEEGKLSVTMPTSEIGLQQISVTIDNPNASTNCYTGGKTAEKAYLVYNDSVQRNVVLEHFTTGQCINCVAGEEKVAGELALVDPSIRVIRINHHAGYGSDKLTTSDDQAMEWFYNKTYVWAPANMIDRTDLAAYGAKGYGGTATIGPIFGTDKSKSISSLITSAYHIPSFITMGLETNVDVDTRELTVNVTADKLYQMPQQDLMRLNVVLVQDSVKAPQTLADGTIDKTFLHHNVYRKALTGTWGETPEFDGNHLEKTFTCTLPSNWTIEHLRIIAFLADYDETNTKNCNIYNATEASLTNATGIETICGEQLTGNVSSTTYNLSGMRVNDNYKGIVIRNGKKILR